MRWFSRYKRRSECRRKYGAACPHPENHSRRQRSATIRSMYVQSLGRYDLPEWSAQPDARRGLGARPAAEIPDMTFAPEAFVPASRSEEMSFPHFSVDLDDLSPGASAPRQQSEM